jgi:hypothetical protein
MKIRMFHPHRALAARGCGHESFANHFSLCGRGRLDDPGLHVDVWIKRLVPHFLRLSALLFGDLWGGSMKRGRRYWTGEMDKILIREYLAGTGKKEIIAKLKKSVSLPATKARLGYLGIKRPKKADNRRTQKPTVWTPEKLSSLRSFAAQEMNAGQIAHRLNIGVDLVRNKAYKLNIKIAAAPVFHLACNAVPERPTERKKLEEKKPCGFHSCGFLALPSIAFCYAHFAAARVLEIKYREAAE